MATIKLQDGENIMSIEVPSIAFGFDVNNYGNSSELMYMISIESTTSEHGDETLKTIELPKGSWKIIR